MLMASCSAFVVLPAPCISVANAVPAPQTARIFAGPIACKPFATPVHRRAGPIACKADSRRQSQYEGQSGGEEAPACVRGGTRREWLLRSAAVVAASLSGITNPSSAAAVASQQAYFQRFPVLFAPLYGAFSKQTLRREVGESIWALEQNLELGPLETPLRSVVIKLRNGKLWVHAPLAPTEEYFRLVESCGDGSTESVAHVVVPTYALEHKVFARDALARWPNAKLWTSPGQFSFPLQSVPDDFVWGRSVSGVLTGADTQRSASQIPWIEEIQYETLTAGTFAVGFSRLTFYETTFYHVASKSLIVTDAVAQIPLEPPALSSADKLLLISKKSTSDALPQDTREARRTGWEKTALLVSYFFPEHEELDPSRIGVVTWTEGWHDNFKAIAGRLLVPPVVRTLIYAQNAAGVQRWVDRVVGRWNFEQIVPAHWDAPIRASPRDLARAFAFLRDESVDAFPQNDLARGLQPIADIFVRNQKGAKSEIEAPP